MAKQEWSPDDLRALVELLRGLAQDESIAALEVSLGSSPSATPTPMPDTAHPAYEAQAISVRSLIDGRSAIRVPRGTSVRAFEMEPDVTAPPTALALHTNTLTVRRCVALAPFVGDPRLVDARYVWQVAIDDAGRWVADSASLVWR